MSRFFKRKSEKMKKTIFLILRLIGSFIVLLAIGYVICTGRKHLFVNINQEIHEGKRYIRNMAYICLLIDIANAYGIIMGVILQAKLKDKKANKKAIDQ